MFNDSYNVMHKLCNSVNLFLSNSHSAANALFSIR